MLDIMQHDYIRTGYYTYGKSIRELERETGHCHKTIKKVLNGFYPKYRLTKEKPSPVLGKYKEIIKEWLVKDQEVPKKQRHTSSRVYQRLKEEHGYQGAESSLRRYVGQLRRELGLSKKEVFIPLEQTFSEAEVDWGTALVKFSGVEKKVKIFVFRAQGSGAIFVRAYPSENQESFLEAHINAFNFFGGVFKTIRYDNLKTAVKKVLKGRERQEQETFKNFRHYYSFTSVFCNPAKGNEKGGVEGIVGYSRRNFMVPVPEVNDFEELNSNLIEKCRNYQFRKVGERKLTVEELLIEETKYLLPLPYEPFPVWKSRMVRVDHYSTVRFLTNRYSVPTDYGYRNLELRATPFSIRVYDKTKLLAEHKRNFEKEQWILNPIHYLKLLSRKPGAFERAKPVKEIKENWPEIYTKLLNRLNDRYGESEGKKQFIEILLLLKNYSFAEMESAIEIVFETGGVSYEVVNHILNWANQKEKSSEQLIFSKDSPLNLVDVSPPSTEHYAMLIGGL